MIRTLKLWGMKYILSIAMVFWCGLAKAVPVYQQFMTKQQIVVSVTTSSAQFLGDNGSRGYLIIQNKGTDAVFLKVGSTITGSEGLVLGAGASYEFHVTPINSIWMKANSGTQSVTILEGQAL